MNATVEKYCTVYQNTGSVETGKWVYQPHDFDSSFELWSKGYSTREEAMEAALLEINSQGFDLEAAQAAEVCPRATRT